MPNQHKAYPQESSYVMEDAPELLLARDDGLSKRDRQSVNTLCLISLARKTTCRPESGVEKECSLTYHTCD